MTTSAKHRLFVLEPMRGKSVKDLPGINDVYASRLEAIGYTQATQLLGEYLIVKQNTDIFEEWLRSKCNSTVTHARDTRRALDDWIHNFI